MEREKIFSYIDQTWPDDPAAELAKRLLIGISRLRQQETTCMSYAELLQLTDLNSVTKDFQSALMILTGSKFAPLKAYGILVDEFGDEYPIRDDDFDNLILEGLLVHPHSGEIIENAAYRVAPVFEVVDFEATQP